MKKAHATTIYYQTASGEPLVNEGEQVVPMVTPSGKLRMMTFQSCDITKPLASVKRMCDAGQIVVFANECHGGSYVLDAESGEKEPLREEEGNYVMDVWVPPPEAVPGFGGHP